MFALVVSCLTFALMGCSALASIEGGYHAPTNGELAAGHRGVTIDAHLGMGWVDAPVGVELALRTKHGSHQGQWAANVGIYAFTQPEVIGLFGRVGFNLLQFETWSGQFAFGMGSPYAQAGFYLMPWLIGAKSSVEHLAAYAFTISASTGYDVRFSDVANSGWWSITCGIAFFAFADE